MKFPEVFYNKQVAKTITAQFPKQMYVTEERVMEIIRDLNEKYHLITRTVDTLWDENISVEDAVDELYPIVNDYFSASLAAM